MNNFCVVPWHSNEIDLKTGQESVCCWLTSPISRHDLQQQFLTGQNPSSCEKCWSNESAGIESRREMENRFLDFKLDRDIEKIQEDARAGRSIINLYQINLGSLCNGTCVTCGPKASTAWQQLTDNAISIKQENASVDKNFEYLQDKIDWKNAKRINLLGGEPLLIKKSFVILKKLLEHNNVNCRVSFVTNGSIKPTPAQLDLISNFTDVSCCVSIDGINKQFEYLRYPLKWDTLIENLDTYKKIFKEVVVSYTISNLNYHSRQETINWFNTNGLLYIENYVNFPLWFNYQVIPGHPLWSRFVDEVRRQDNLKGISIKDYLPEVADQIEKSCL